MIAALRVLAWRLSCVLGRHQPGTVLVGVLQARVHLRDGSTIERDNYGFYRVYECARCGAHYGREDHHGFADATDGERELFEANAQEIP